jgi:hypothetical protein
VKQSIDHALNTLKSHAHSDSHPHTLAHTPSKRHSSPGESASPFREYTFYPTPDVDANDNSSSRRPSLPHIYDDLTVPPRSKRPRSARQDAEPEPPRAPSVQRKLGSKYSLLNLFAKQVIRPMLDTVCLTLPITSRPYLPGLLPHHPPPLVQFPCPVHPGSTWPIYHFLPQNHPLSRIGIVCAWQMIRARQHWPFSYESARFASRTCAKQVWEWE